MLVPLLMVVKQLRAALGDARVSTDAGATSGRRHVYWFLSQLDDAQGRAAPPPLCVVRPSSTADVVQVVDICRKARAPLVPFGLGSGVTGGVLVSSESVVLDMSAMNAVRTIDATNLLASFDAGVRGTDAEAAANGAGLTLGHFPQSIGVSSVGGWVATRAAGQYSTGYGNIEDLLFSLEAVLPNGKVLQTKHTPRASAGPDLRHFLLGSEGTLGVVTGVTFSARRLPERRECRAFHVPSMARGFEFQREIVQQGHAPVVLRQYDLTETERMFGSYTRGGDSLILAVFEGPAARVLAEVSAVEAIAEKQGALAAPAEATEHWLAQRNHVPTFDQFIHNGVVVDTIEVASTWDRVNGIYDAAVASLMKVPGILAGSAHSSHVYRSGINLYFTFVARPERAEDMRATYLECWRVVLAATVDGGGGIAHHHGIGRVRRDWLPNEVGAEGITALRALKTALDPEGFMNPGALLLP